MIRVHLARLLADKKMKQLDFAKLSGIDKNAVHNIYYEKKFPRRDTLNTICKVLGCRIDELLEYIPDEESEKSSAGEKSPTNR